jgi:hypothetical protein
MPTVLRIGALRVAIYPNDHRPAHVHVIGNGHEAVFNLNQPAGFVALREHPDSPRRVTPSMNSLSDPQMHRAPSIAFSWRWAGDHNPQSDFVHEENYGFSARDLIRIRAVIEQNLEALTGDWERIHGIR